MPGCSETEYANKYFSIHGEGSCSFVIALIGASSKPLNVVQYKRALLKKLFQDNIFLANLKFQLADTRELYANSEMVV